MKLVHYEDVPEEEVKMQGAYRATVRWLISEQDGAENCYLRMFKLAPGGYTPFHQHDYEHEIYVLSGEGWLNIGEDKTRHKFGPGTVIFVPPLEYHQLVNSGQEELIFLCLIPKI